MWRSMWIHSLLIATAGWLASADQETIDYLASNIAVEYHVLDNLGPSGNFDGLIVMTNVGTENVTSVDWALYLCSWKILEPGAIWDGEAPLADTGLVVSHINGNLHRIEPTANFSGFTAGRRLDVPFVGSWAQVEATETLPNWYFVGPGAEARVVASTAGESLDWIGPFDTEHQWKRDPSDLYDPYTGPVRLDMYDYEDLGSAPTLVIPTPVEQGFIPDSFVNIGTGDWIVVVLDPSIRPEAEFLAAQLNMAVVDPEHTPASHYVTLDLDTVLNGTGSPVSVPGAYRFEVNGTSETISIVGLDSDGAFYGGQTLFSLYETNELIPCGYVVDYPRFPYRGLHVDVSRNFHDKQDIMRHLDVMGLYKMNKLHIHMTDDEGWRLEIPGIPELTEFGARRCHDPSGDLCLLPQHGSAPGLTNDGTGYYTVDDYREILRFAADRHIEVISEFDMPGHATAAVEAMLVRYRKYVDVNETMATEFLLSDLNDTSSYMSGQYFRNNSINVCVNSTYNFVRHLVSQLKAIHADIQPIKTFNFGGDEVPGGAWSGSPICQAMGDINLKNYFVQNVAQIAADEGLDLSGWEDTFMWLDINTLPTTNNYAYHWYNMFEWGGGEGAYRLANNGYKTILASATHFYFDHPYEPDPYDRGLYWATRLAASRKAFNFMPDDMYENMGVDSYGYPLNKDEICETYGCMPLEPDKVDNVIGIQAQVWSETVRNSQHLDYMIWPRLICLAERGWHKADWESITNSTDRQVYQTADWQRFANTVGYKELTRLDRRNVQYAITPPGARITGSNRLEAMPEFPGQPVQWSDDGGQTWTDYTEGTEMSPGTIQVVTRSIDKRRGSRVVTLEVS